MPEPEPGASYLVTRQRLLELLATLDDDQWATPVAATPGWQVRDVVAHMVAICEDALAGKLTGPPPDEITAQQVERFRPFPPDQVLRAWEPVAEPFAELIDAFQVWNPVYDVWTHEQDIRTAVGRPGGRDHPVVRRLAQHAVDGMDVEGQIVFEPDEGGEPLRGAAKPGPEYRLRTSLFELVRLYVGRRCPEQVAALDWSTDPTPILGGLFIFGPRTDPLVE